MVLGLAFLVALAVERGWIDERARVALAFATAGAIFGVGIWLSETRRRNQASLAMVGTGLAGLYLALTAAASFYHLVPVALAFVVALAIGAAGAALAVLPVARSWAGRQRPDPRAFGLALAVGGVVLGGLLVRLGQTGS